MPSAARKAKVGLELVVAESTEEILARRSERRLWPPNGLKPRGSLKLKLTKRQQRILQTPSYMR